MKCNSCQEDKEELEFYSCKHTKSGLRRECKICSKEKTKNHPKTKEQMKNTRLKMAFGITLENYKRMYDSQNGVCAICGKSETVQNVKGITSFLAVDHCHKTGKIRGLLCSKCNTGLGKFEDHEENMLKAVEYLRSNKTKYND